MEDSSDDSLAPPSFPNRGSREAPHESRSRGDPLSRANAITHSISCSSVFVEANEVCVLSKASSADHKLILSDKTVSGVADSASS